MNIILQSDRLSFREFIEDDAALVYRLNTDPKVLKYIHELPPENIESAAKTISERIIPQYQNYGYGRWAVFIKNNHEFIGWCGLKFRPELNETDLGYRFIPAHWGKGYAFEAAQAVLNHGFTILKLQIITARAHTANIASQKVLEKCGMIFQKFEEVDHCPVKTYSLSTPSIY